MKGIRGLSERRASFSAVAPYSKPVDELRENDKAFKEMQMNDQASD